MNPIDLVEKSELWDARYGLPTIPMHNNPFLYIALVSRCITSAGFDLPVAWVDKMNSYSFRCHRHPNTRWPDGRGGDFSHDEMIGAAYMIDADAASFKHHLEKDDGLYPDEHGDLYETRNFYRFPFLMPYLRARLRMKLSMVSQAAWSLYVLKSALTNKKTKIDPSGLIKIWLMGESIPKMYPLMNGVYSFWKAMMSWRGVGPKYVFTNVYLNECPTMREIAPEEF